MSDMMSDIHIPRSICFGKLNGPFKTIFRDEKKLNFKHKNKKYLFRIKFVSPD